MYWPASCVAHIAGPRDQRCWDPASVLFTNPCVLCRKVTPRDRGRIILKHEAPLKTWAPFKNWFLQGEGRKKVTVHECACVCIFLISPKPPSAHQAPSQSCTSPKVPHRQSNIDFACTEGQARDPSPANAGRLSAVR